MKVSDIVGFKNKNKVLKKKCQLLFNINESCQNFLMF